MPQLRLSRAPSMAWIAALHVMYAEWIGKCDDDTLLNVPRLMARVLNLIRRRVVRSWELVSHGVAAQVSMLQTVEI